MLRQKYPLVLIHGFLGSPSDWDPILDYFEDIPFYSLDLNSLFPKEDPLYSNSFSSLIDNILSYLKKRNISKFHLVGYSLGGRIAMALSQKITPLSLTLLGAHFGLTEEEDKKKRWEKDLLIASLLNKLTKKKFLEKWYSNPLFPPHLKDVLVANRLTNPADTDLLEKMLLNLNLSKQPCFLPYLPPKTVFLYGEKDIKYKHIYSNSLRSFPKMEIPSVYHCLHLEAPKKIASILRANYLNKR